MRTSLTLTCIITALCVTGTSDASQRVTTVRAQAYDRSEVSGKDCCTRNVTPRAAGDDLLQTCMEIGGNAVENIRFQDDKCVVAENGVYYDPKFQCARTAIADCVKR